MKNVIKMSVMNCWPSELMLAANSNGIFSHLDIRLIKTACLYLDTCLIGSS